MLKSKPLMKGDYLRISQHIHVLEDWPKPGTPWERRRFSEAGLLLLDMGTGNQPAEPCSSPGASAGSRTAGLHPPRHFLSLPCGFCSLDGTSNTLLGQYCGVSVLLQSSCTKHSRFINVFL